VQRAKVKKGLGARGEQRKEKAIDGLRLEYRKTSAQTCKVLRLNSFNAMHGDAGKRGLKKRKMADTLMKRKRQNCTNRKPHTFIRTYQKRHSQGEIQNGERVFKNISAGEAS